MKRDQPSAAGKELIDILLHLFESNEPTTFTFQVIKHRSQTNEFLRAASLGAMVILLSVSGRAEMLIEVAKLSELLVTQEAFKSLPVPRSVCCDGLHVGFSVPANQILGKAAVRVSTTKFAVDRIAIHSSSIWARPSLQMMGNTAG